MTYLPFVDGLRAVAIAAVVAFHAFPAVARGGFAGVDVFFVISGFLITRFIAAEISDGTFSLGRFFIRRARRLLPASLVCFAAVTGLAALVLLPDAFFNYGRSLLSSVLAYANIYFYKTSGYFSAPSLEKPLLHTWSLAVEDQFYLTWPLLLMLAMPRISKRTLLSMTAGLIAASLLLAEVMLARNPDFVFYMLPARAWELLLGAFLALAATRITLSKAAAEALSVIGMAAILASVAVLTSGYTFPGIAAVPACLGAAAVIASGLSHPTVITRFLSLRPVVFVGLISYSLYLWHWPLISLLNYRLERPLTPVEAAAVVAVSVALAYLSWRFVERPFRATHEQFSGLTLRAKDQHFAVRGLAGVAGFAVLAVGIIVSKGAPERFGPSVRPMLVHMVSGNPLRRFCDNFENIFARDAVCNFGRKKAAGESYDIAVFGDSMADHWVPLVTKYAEEMKLSGRQVTNGGCAMLLGAFIPATPAAKAVECANYQQQAQKFADANPHLKLAVMSGFWEKWLDIFEAKSSTREHPTEAEETGSHAVAPAFDKVLADTVEVFTRRGTKVLLIGQIPVYTHLPVRCIVAALKESADAGRCGLATRDVERQLSDSNAALLRLAALNPNVAVFLPSDVMCGPERCPPVIDGVMLYKNEGHINKFGAEYLRRFVTFPVTETAGTAKP